MAVKFLDNLDLVGNQFKNALLDVQGGNPTPLGEGQIYFDSTTGVKALKYYNGTDWINPADGSFTSWIIQGDAGVDQTINDGNTLIVNGLNGITTKGLATDTLQVTLDATAVTAGSYTLANITVDAQGRITSAANGSSGSMSNWNMKGDDAANRSITNGATITFSGGTGITTVSNNPAGGIFVLASSLDNTAVTAGSYTTANITVDAQGRITSAANGTSAITYTLPTGVPANNVAKITLTGSDSSVDAVNFVGTANQMKITAATQGSINIGLADSITTIGDLTVGGGDITLSGTGRIQGIDTVTASTDAASKAYVDSSVAGGLNVKGGFNANTGAIQSGGNLTSGGSRVAITVGDYYVVTTAGNFFGNAATPLTTGDSVLVQTAAIVGESAESDFAIIQSDTDLATATTVGIGNVNVDGAGSKAGLSLSYATGTGTVGVNINTTTAAADALPSMKFLVYDEGDTSTNLKLDIGDLTTYINANTSREFSGTSASGTTHTFTHNLNTRNVSVQLFDTSSFETVYATVVRTSVNVVTVTTAASADITCLITKIG